MAVAKHLPILPPNPSSTWFWVSRGIIFCISIAGNGLVVYLILTRSRLLRNVSNWFVLSLALADVVVTFVTIPEMVYALIFDNTYPWPLKMAYDAATMTSIINLCFMTLERFVAVVYPLKYTHLISNHRVVAVSILAVAWLVGILSPWPCYICYSLEKLHAFRILQVAYLFVAELLPIFALMFVYIKMLFVIWKQESSMRVQAVQVRYNYGDVFVQKNRVDKRNRSIIQVIGVILLIYAVCYVLSFYKGFKNYVLFEEVGNWLVTVTRLLYQVNSAVNGYAYALIKKDFRREVKVLIQKAKSMKITLPEDRNSK